MTGFLFELTFVLAAPVWLLMIVAPGRRLTERVAASPLTVLPVLAVYLVLVAPVVPELWAAVSSPDLDVFRDLTASPNGAATVWAQIIAWDLLLGQWIYREGRRLGFSPFLMSPLLVLTILLSPIALLVFLPIRATALHKHPRERPA
ncbi:MULTISPECIES: ABA4-like family protein [unclassified Streptomyces]|uniref:ABA4-like family protein n=1 Tax=unclassified Streptomyces TaxID=2593676 RepID=UPI002E34181A|nr:ABA4-like family protein [Streptomyces sp. NBC_01268]